MEAKEYWKLICYTETAFSRLVILRGVETETIQDQEIGRMSRLRSAKTEQELKIVYFAFVTFPMASLSDNKWHFWEGLKI